MGEEYIPFPILEIPYDSFFFHPTSPPPPCSNNCRGCLCKKLEPFRSVYGFCEYWVFRTVQKLTDLLFLLLVHLIPSLRFTIIHACP